jgi:hypothetical protein
MRAIEQQVDRTGLGVVFLLPLPEIERLIRDAGFIPIRRNTGYETLDPRPADVGE